VGVTDGFEKRKPAGKPADRWRFTSERDGQRERPWANLQGLMPGVNCQVARPVMSIVIISTQTGTARMP